MIGWEGRRREAGRKRKREREEQRDGWFGRGRGREGKMEGKRKEV